MNYANKKIGQQATDTIRAMAVAMEKANSGHPVGPMGGTDFIHIPYSEFMDSDPFDLRWPLRDRLIMDAEIA